jgi:hypothetical protein
MEKAYVITSHRLFDVDIAVRTRRSRVFQPFKVGPLLLPSGSKTNEVGPAITLFKLTPLGRFLGQGDVFVNKRVGERKWTCADRSMPGATTECTKLQEQCENDPCREVAISLRSRSNEGRSLAGPSQRPVKYPGYVELALAFGRSVPDNE